MYDAWHIEDVCEIYFHFVGMMIRERFCDVVGHLDLPKKMGSMPAGGMLRYVEPLIPDLLANDIAVEINTSGLDNPAREFMPGWDVVEALASRGVPLTLGSDAHAPHQVGRPFRQGAGGLAESRRQGTGALRTTPDDRRAGRLTIHDTPRQRGDGSKR